MARRREIGAWSDVAMVVAVAVAAFVETDGHAGVAYHAILALGVMTAVTDFHPAAPQVEVR